MVSYRYDAWGNLLETSGDKASTVGLNNPLRYRGYVYDRETKLYYLQSRYYDPEMGCFLNADTVYDYGAGIQGFNLFVYCGNDPIGRIDASGANSEKHDDDQIDDEVQARGGGADQGGGGITSDSGAGGSGNSGKSRGFRGDLQQLSGQSGESKDAHHVYPQKFKGNFKMIGIEVNNASNGAWWESMDHRSSSYQYNLWWEAFFMQDDVTASDAFALGEFLAGLFGFEWGN